MYSLMPFMNIYFSLQKFAMDFVSFLTTSINSYFDINIGALGDITGLEFFFGAGILVIIAFVLIDLFIPL